MNPIFIAMKVLDTALLVGEFRAEDREQLESGVAMLKAMLRENRKPTDEEWSAINDISDAALARLSKRVSSGS